MMAVMLFLLNSIYLHYIQAFPGEIPFRSKSNNWNKQTSNCYTKVSSNDHHIKMIIMYYTTITVY